MAEEYANLQEFFEADEEVVEDGIEEDTGETTEGEAEEAETGEAQETKGQDGEGAEATDEAGEPDQPEPDQQTGEGDGTDEEAGDGESVALESDDIDTLRQMLREQAQEIQTLKAQSQKLNTTLADQGTIEESDLEPGEQESGGITDERIQSLSLLAETMKMNPNYSDFDEVCSQPNFNMTVDALAKIAVQEEGGTLTEQVQNVTNYIWALPNPYKFVYDIVKENHPKYRPAEEQDTGNKPTVKRETPAAPGSVANVAGGSSSKNEGWTAAKIDALDEMELDKVPAAVYDKYMLGELK